MKYVMLETADGQKLPIIFPESLVHADVADVVGRLVDRTLTKQLGKRRALPKSAGFIAIHDCDVSGASESLGGVASHYLDAARIMAGASVTHMPDILLAPIAHMMGKSQKVKPEDFE